MDVNVDIFSLPDEMLVDIFEKLDLESKLRLIQTSPQLKSFLEDYFDLKKLIQYEKLPYKTNWEFLKKLIRLNKEIDYLNNNYIRFEKYRETHAAIFNQFIQNYNSQLSVINVLFKQYQYPECDDIFNQLQRKLNDINSLTVNFQAQFCEIGQANFSSGQYFKICGITRLSDQSIVNNLDLFKHVTNLDLADNLLETIPNNIKRCENIEILNLYNNPITNLPDDLASCDNLKHLWMSNGWFEYLPEVIYKLTNLESLFCLSMHLKTLGPKISNLINLKSLCIDQNDFTWLPSEVFKLKKLTDLNINLNPINGKPKEVSSTDCRQLLMYFHNFARLEKISNRTQELSDRLDRLSFI